MQFQLIKPNQYRTMLWKNGQGSTTELLIEPANAIFSESDFDWRLSIAVIERDSEFSPLPNYDRAFTVIEGEGVDLIFADGETIVMNERGKIANFSGERLLRARLHNGLTRDFNLITRRDRFSGELLLRPLVGSMLGFLESNSTLLVYQHLGECEVQADSTINKIVQGELLCIQATANSSRVLIYGSGELVIAKIFKAKFT